MNEIEFLELLSSASYIEMFEVIDDDGIRKSAVKATTIPSAFDDQLHQTKRITLIVDWRLLNKYLTKDKEEE